MSESLLDLKGFRPLEKAEKRRKNIGEPRRNQGSPMVIQNKNVLGFLHVRNEVSVILLLKQGHLFRNGLVFDGDIIFCGHVYAPSSDFSWVRNDKNQEDKQV
jgi:hypothetical protein